MKTRTQLFLMIVVAVFTSTVASASSVALTPLSAQYALALDAESAGSVKFPVIGGGTVQITVPAPPTAELILTTPDGTAYGSESSPTGIVAFHYLPASEGRDAVGPRHATWLVALESVQPGGYALSISNAGDPNAALPVSVQHLDAPIRTGAAVGLGQGAHRVGQPVVVAAYIHDDFGPVPNATVSATMTMSDGTPVSSATLKNDGVAPDTSAGDGTYVAILTPMVEGIASVRIVINGMTVTGHPYRATHGALLTVGATDELELSGDFQDEGVDSNGDGLFDELRLRFGYIGKYDEAPYGLRVILEADNGQRVDGYGALAGGELISRSGSE